MKLPDNIVNVCIAYDRKAYRKQVAVSYYDENNKKQIERFDVNPYFYVRKDAKIPSDIQNSIHIEQTDVPYYKGDKLKKIVMLSANKQDVENIVSKFDETFEADLNLARRFMIDYDVKFSRKQRILFLDIETLYSIDEKNTPEPILSIYTYDSFMNRYYAFCWHKDLEVRCDKKDNESIYYFNDEREMLEEFMHFLSSMQCEIFTGWFIDGFDMPYIINRCKKLNVDFSRISPLGRVAMFEQKNEEDIDQGYRIIIDGASVIDCRAAYKKLAIYGKPPNYKLDTVAKFALHDETKMTRPDFGSVWCKDRMHELLEYNRQDVRLCVLLNKKLKLIDYFLRIQQEVSLSLEDIFMTSRVVDTFILQAYHNQYVFPTKMQRPKVEIGGGHVITPPSEKFEDVIILDFKAMYTTIYISFNISPELIIEKDHPHANFKDATCINGIWFDMTRGQGIIPKLLEELLNRRIAMQKERDKYNADTVEYKAADDAQGTYKEILNTFFGAMGYSNFRMFDPRVANSITFIGREMLKFTIEQLEGMKYKVLYADTDSCFFQIPHRMLDIDKVVFGKKVVDDLNAKLTTDFVAKFTENKLPFEKCNIEIEFESMFSQVVFPGVKKRYAGLLNIKKGSFSNHSFKCMGFEVVRKDTPVVIRETLEAIFITRLKGDDSKVLKLISDTITKMSTLEYPYELGIPKPISKDFDEYKSNAQHIRAAKWAMDNAGVNWLKGDRGYMLYVKCRSDCKLPYTDVVLVKEDTKLPEGVEIDINTLVEKYLYSPLEFFDNVKGMNKIELPKLAGGKDDGSKYKDKPKPKRKRDEDDDAKQQKLSG